LTALAAVILMACTFSVQSKTSTDAAVPPTMGLSELPREGQATYQLIRQGGPFPYEKDGVVFGNRERLLPRQDRGYYREYTVKTPGSRDRGARRIVCGGQEPRHPRACYYTQDHYASFREIVDKN
jgi:ribonuclease T1